MSDQPPKPYPPLPRASLGAAGYAVLDVETTGLSSSDRVLQIAIARLGPDAQPVDEWSTLIDPGRDPGPVDIHGVTVERLAGAPSFADVADEIRLRLAGRLLVAHNAAFDARMVRAEFRAIGEPAPPLTRLCTITLARRLELPVPDFKLATLADHFGVTNLRAHDALFDVRATVQVFAQLLAEAQRYALQPPLARFVAPAGPRAARTRPEFEPVGLLQPGAPLQQGMSVLVSGATVRSRRELAGLARRAGLATVARVPEAGLVVVGAGQTRKAHSARAAGLQALTEEAFVTALAQVLPGTPLPPPVEKMPAPGTPERPVEGEGSAKVEGSGDVERPTDIGRLVGQRVLVLNGAESVTEAVCTRGRLAEAGAVVHASLTRSTTAVLVLPGGETDARAGAASALGLVRTEAELHGLPGSEPTVLAAGRVLTLQPGLRFVQLACTWQVGVEIAPQVRLHGAPGEPGFPDDLVTLTDRSADDGALTLHPETEGEAGLNISLASLDDSVQQISLELKAARVEPVEVRVIDGGGVDIARALVHAGIGDRVVLSRASGLERGEGTWQTWQLCLLPGTTPATGGASSPTGSQASPTESGPTGAPIVRE